MFNLIYNLPYYLFSGLFFLTPLVFFPKTSELFEFNKMVLVYGLTILITTSWLIKMLISQKLIFKKTKLDILMMAFLASQIISTFLSIDPRTSIFGYYSRFHGGLLSSISYCLLYWGYVSNIDHKKAIKHIYILILSALVVSIYAILQHLGIDKNLWVQDVQRRVFSTVGQPNWLAAWIVALMPINWAMSIVSKTKKQTYIWLLLSIIFFTVLVFTKSKSGFLGFGVSFFVFWLFLLLRQISGKKINIKTFLHPFLKISLSVAVLIILLGTPWTTSLEGLLTKKLTPDSEKQTIPKYQGPALEVGGTDSGKIRLLVWQGAINAWKAYPLLGSGVETFTYSFYKYRPPEHNLVSEWDFLYNKAHNEYLNFLATTGIVGLTVYFLLIVGIIRTIVIPNQWLDNSQQTVIKGSKLTPKYIYLTSIYWKVFGKSDSNNTPLQIALLAGFISILITNFFGFSVVIVALLFFLLPAFSVSLNKQVKVSTSKPHKISMYQNIFISLSTVIAFFFLFQLGKYWYADILYAKGVSANDIGDPIKARKYLQQAINLCGKEPFFWSELSQSTSDIAVAYLEISENEKAAQFADISLEEGIVSINLSPADVNMKRNLAANLSSLYLLDIKYLQTANQILLQAKTQAPNDPKILYNLGYSYVRLGDLQKAKETFEKTVEIKPNYRNARYGLALVLWDLQQRKSAKEQFEYILENIAPHDSEVERQLEELKSEM